MHSDHLCAERPEADDRKYDKRDEPHESSFDGWACCPSPEAVACPSEAASGTSSCADLAKLIRTAEYRALT